MPQKFERFLARNDLDKFQFGDCFKCKETVIRATNKRTQQYVVLDPKSVGGTELNQLYDRHVCREVL